MEDRGKMLLKVSKDAFEEILKNYNITTTIYYDECLCDINCLIDDIENYLKYEC